MVSDAGVGRRRRLCCLMINSVTITSGLSYFVKSVGGAKRSAGGGSFRIFEKVKLNGAEFEIELIRIGNLFSPNARNTAKAALEPSFICATASAESQT